MTRKIFDWHPDLNLFAQKIPGRIQILIHRDGEYRLPLLEEVGFVDADHVADYVFGEESGEDLPNLDGVCIKSSWPLAWIEYTVPSGTAFEDEEMAALAKQIYGQIPGGLQIGTYIFSYEVKEHEQEAALKNDLAMQLLSVMDTDMDPKVSLPIWKAYSAAQGRDKLMWRLSTQYECHSIQVMSVYMADRDKWYQSGYHISYLDEHGVHIPGATANVVDPEDAMSQAISTAPILMALGLLNCRNVETKFVPSSGHQIKKLKRHGSPVITRKTLLVKPQGKRYESSGQDTGGKRRWHMARGHFKTFTDEAPLFGRVVGTFWWQSQTRGSKHLGEVHKDYEVDNE